MSVNLIHRFRILLIAGVFLLLQCSCARFYKRNYVQSEEMYQMGWKEYLESATVTYPYLVVVPLSAASNPYTNQTAYHLSNYTFTDDQVIGDLEKANMYMNIDFPPGSNMGRGRVPTAYRDRFFKSLTIFTNQEDIGVGGRAISYENIQRIQTYDRNVGLNTGLNILIGTGYVMAASTVFLIIACNCPRVYAMTEDGPAYQGAMLTGAISKSLEREDLLLMQKLKAEDGKIKISVKNELPEEEYLDEIKLLKIQLPTDAIAAYDEDGGLFTYRDAVEPEKAQNTQGIQLGETFEQKDEMVYGFDDAPEDKALNTVFLEFDSRELGEDPNKKLIIKGRQTEWLEQTGEAFFSLFGTDFEKWSQKMDKVDPQKYLDHMSRQGISLNAYVETPKGWELIGSYHNAGILKAKEMGLDLNLMNVHGDKIRIKLTSAYKFWELDYVGIADSWNNIESFEEVPLLSAVNEQGLDMEEMLETQDEKYAVLPQNNSGIELEFEATAGPNERYVLKGAGFYRHQREYTHKPNKALLMRLKFKGAYATQFLSKELEQVMSVATAEKVIR